MLCGGQKIRVIPHLVPAFDANGVFGATPQLCGLVNSGCGKLDTDDIGKCLFSRAARGPPSRPGLGELRRGRDTPVEGFGYNDVYPPLHEREQRFQPGGCGSVT